MLSRVHQKGCAGVTVERRGVSGMFFILNIADRARLVRIIADDESAALERELTFGLGNHSFEGLPANQHRPHRLARSRPPLFFFASRTAASKI
jgi:hypothetical protein